MASRPAPSAGGAQEGPRPGRHPDKPSSIERRRAQARRAPSAGYAERRQRLLTAAAGVFKDKGLDATSIHDIAERAGADRASVYYYFGSKQEIFLALIRQAVDEIVPVAEDIAASSEPPAARLRRLVVSQLAAFENHYPYLYLYFQENMNRVPGEGTADLRAMGRRYEAAIERIIGDGIDSGEFRAGLDQRIAMFEILGALNWAHRWFSPGGRLTGSDVGDIFADIFLHGVAARAEG